VIKKYFSASIFLLLFIASLFLFENPFSPTKVTGAPPYGEPETAAPDNLDPYAWLKDWKRPEGPTKVALQVGHLNSAELPEELERIRGNTGASAAGHTEVEVNETIAHETKKLLEEKGIIVEILPATIPEKYYADAFVAIHADGSESYLTSGYKSSAPWRDFSAKSSKLNEYIKTSYGEVTEMDWDDNITRNMRGYYAFSFWRYTHAVHPMTPSVILETGFLTNYNDRQIIVEQPELSAKGLADGIVRFLESEQLL
jgi:N-acetylmuramoyl-L-alanine amidase